MTSVYIILFLWFILFFCYFQPRRQIIKKIIAKKHHKKGNRIMTELIQKYIGKECFIYTMNSQVSGTILSVSDGWIELDSGELINLDYIIRIREFPKNKKGKKKSIVLD